MADELFPEPTPNTEPFDPHAVGEAVRRGVEASEARRKEWREAGLLHDEEEPTEPTAHEDAVGRIPTPREIRLARVARARQALHDAVKPPVQSAEIDAPAPRAEAEWDVTDEQREAGRRGIDDARRQLP